MTANSVPTSSTSSVNSFMSFLNSFIFLATFFSPPFYTLIISRMRDIVNNFHISFSQKNRQLLTAYKSNILNNGSCSISAFLPNKAIDIELIA